MDTMAPPDVVFRVETLSDALWSELEPLLAKHWSEVETEQDFPPLPDKDQYARIEACGMLKVYCARVGERLVGYLAVFMCGALHSRGITVATGDVLFIDPEHRGNRLGSDLIRFAKEHLRQLGVAMIYLHSKHRAGVNIGPLLGRLGFRHDEDVWSIRLDEE
jgi:GNAT superfamily N-acetyltransferase